MKNRVKFGFFQIILFVESVSLKSIIYINTYPMKNRILLNLFLFLVAIPMSYAQDTIYFDKHENILPSIKKATSYRVVKCNAEEPNKGVATVYYISGKMKSQGEIVADDYRSIYKRKGMVLPIIVEKGSKRCWTYNGTYTEWFENGDTKYTIEVKQGVPDGQLITYWPKNILKIKQEFKAGKPINHGANMSSSESQPYRFFRTLTFGSDQVRTFQSFFLDKYEKSDMDTVPGVIYFYSYHNKEGEVNDVELLKGLTPNIDKQIIKIFKKLPTPTYLAMRNDEQVSFIGIILIYLNKPIYTLNILQNLSGKDTLMFDADGFVTRDKNKSNCISIFTTAKGNSDLVLQQNYFKDGSKVELEFSKSLTLSGINSVYSDLERIVDISTQRILESYRVLNGTVTFWDSKGLQRYIQNYKGNKRNGKQTYYAEDGTVSHTAEFNNGKLISGKLPQSEEENSVFTVVEKMPEFVGGSNALSTFLSTHTRYPAGALERKVTGKVIMRFAVMSDGSISNIQVLRSVDPDLDAEAKRVIGLMPKWIPGTQNGVPVSVWYTLPIAFNMIENTKTTPMFKGGFQ